MLIKIQLFVYFNRNLSLELRQILRFTDYKYDNTTRCVDNTSKILKIGFVCIQNVSDVVISVIRNINDFVYHQNHLRPRSHGIRRCSAAAPRRVCRPMYLPDNQHQKENLPIPDYAYVRSGYAVFLPADKNTFPILHDLPENPDK